jgi:AdoMet-dependent heme synthase
MEKGHKEISIEKNRRLNKFLEGKKMPPARCMIFLTNRCNLDCLYCTSRNNNSGQKELSDERLKEIVQESKKLGVLRWRLSGGGEPLLHKSSISIIEEIKKLGMFCEIITNGTLIDKNIAKKLIEAGLDVLSISIDSSQKSINDCLRSKGALKKSIKGIKYINYWKKVLKKEKPRISFLTVVNNKNYNKMEDLFKLAVRCGCEMISLNPLNVYNNASKSLTLSEEQMKELHNYISTLKEENGIRVFRDLRILLPLPIFEDNKYCSLDNKENKSNRIDKINCLEPFHSIQILPDGRVSPCCLGVPIRAVNLNDTSLENIWFGKEYEELRESILKGENHPMCKDCIETTRSESDRIKKGQS